MFPAMADPAFEMQSLTLETQRYTIRLVQQGDGWVAADRGYFPVKSALAEAIVAALSDFVASEIRSVNPADYADLDVEGPGSDRGDVAITMTDADGNAVAAAIIGIPGMTTSTRRPGIHVRVADATEVWMVEGFVTFPRLLAQWFDPVAQIPGPSIDRISILSGDRLLLTAGRSDASQGDYQLIHLDEELGELERAAVDIRAVRALAGAIVTIAPGDVMSRSAVAIGPEARTLRYETVDGLVVDATIVPVGEENWALLGASTRAGANDAAIAAAATINSVSDQWAFALSEQVIGRLTVDISELYVVITQDESEFF